MFMKKVSMVLVGLGMTLSLHASDPFFDDPFGDDIFQEMMQMQKQMDSMFARMHQRIQQRQTHQLQPLGNYQVKQRLVDKGSYYLLRTVIPESQENEIHLKVDDRVLSLHAKMVKNVEKRDKNGYASSRSMQLFQERIPLPEDANEKEMQTAYEGGKLVIKIAKKALKQPLKPQLKASKEKNSSQKASQSLPSLMPQK